MANRGRSLKEAKAEKAAKKRRARRRKRAIVMIVEVMTLCILLGIGFVLTKLGKMQKYVLDDGGAKINEGAGHEDYITIALFGGDSREGQLDAGTHADTIIIVSIDDKTKDVRMASIYRDTLVEDTDGEMRKANSAYFLGGPVQAIEMLNKNFDLDIQHFVTVDFKALADAIDLLGGIEIDVSDDEASEVMRYIGETATVVGKKAVSVKGGLQTLDGVQAVTYARIRKNVGGDYARTERQRLVIQKIVEKVKQEDIVTINSILDQILPQVMTSVVDNGEIYEMAKGAGQYNIVETKGFPFEHRDDSVEGVGSVVTPVDLVKNVEDLHAFLYPDDDYHMTQKVKDIAVKIETTTGGAQE